MAKNSLPVRRIAADRLEYEIASVREKGYQDDDGNGYAEKKQKQ